MPKVSIIIPTYNVENYLVECLESVVNQTLQDIEIICVDDGSTDSSGKILDEYAAKDSRIKVIHKENGGYGKAMNVGMDNATGEYIGIVEPDDYIELNMYEELYKIAHEKDLDLIKANFYRYSSMPEISNKITEPFCKKNVLDKIINPLDFIETFNGTACIWTGLYKKEFLINKNIRFLETPGASFQDTSFNIQTLIETNKAMMLREAFYHYRIDNENSSVKSNTKIFCICDEMNYLEEKYKNSSTKIKRILNTLKIDKYTWNYNRLNKEGKKEFLKAYKKELLPIIKHKKYIPNFIPEFIINNAKKILNIKKPFTKKLFAVENSKNKKHKIITILGIKLKIKRNEFTTKEKLQILEEKNYGLFEYTNFKDNEIHFNSVLIVEPNACHSEVSIGMAKYFIDLGYNVDILLNPKEYELYPYARFKDKKLRVFCMSLRGIEYILQSNILNQYKFLYFNSEIVYRYNTKVPFFFKNILIPPHRILQMCHRLEELDNLWRPDIKYLQLTKLNFKSDCQTNIINPHYYGEIKVTPKNDITNFIIVGNLEKGRRNFNLLINALLYLTKNNITNFKITVVCRNGNIKHFPKQLRRFIDFKGSLNYPDMFNEIEKADFFLPLLDPENPEHDRYLTTGTSGSFQIIYGFRLPCIINEKFAKLHYFNTGNSLIYNKNNELGETLEKAIQMNQTEYSKLQTNLETVSKNLTELSINNLKEIL